MLNDFNTETDRSALGKRYFGIADIDMDNSLTPITRSNPRHLLTISNSAGFRMVT
ncbi:hypothetical protein HanPSC8_Chr14g0626701 [Helianthus annuus]|nr:hypothetical protein HanPSC8_Chr14g0626701 [Helianthus annuus]